MERITVRAAFPDKVCLWETHPDHPDGEVFVSGDSEVQVALTAKVKENLKLGLLIQVGDKTPAVAVVAEKVVEEAVKPQRKAKG